MSHREIRERAQKLRNTGMSYGSISRELGVAKSTLSYWFSSTSHYLSTSEKQLEHLKRARTLSTASIFKKSAKKKLILQEKITNELIDFNPFDVFSKKIALSMLYWAEGTKHKKAGGLTFTNTDPMLIQVFISLLKQVYNIDLGRIKLRLAIHSYHNETECKEFWSNLIGININQFNKTYIKPRSTSKKFRENFRGICFVYYPNSDIRKEILEIGRQFCQKISLP